MKFDLRYFPSVSNIRTNLSRWNVIPTQSGSNRTSKLWDNLQNENHEEKNQLEKYLLLDLSYIWSKLLGIYLYNLYQWVDLSISLCTLKAIILDWASYTKSQTSFGIVWSFTATVDFLQIQFFFSHPHLVPAHPPILFPLRQAVQVWLQIIWLYKWDRCHIWIRL